MLLSEEYKKRIKKLAGLACLNENKKISYSAVVLDTKSRNLLLSKFKNFNIPEKWEVIANHMTINLGELKDKSILHKKIKLKAIAFSIDDKVAAIKVSSPIEHYEDLPHITLAVNREGEGTPKQSKELKKWKPIGRPFYIFGEVEEIPLLN